MKIGTWLVGTAVVALSVLNVAAEKVESDIDGATPGKWTMDFEAAKKVAAEKKLPILMDFSGTDWCYWCKIMEKNVFTKPEWAEYAKGNLVMVLIDFPGDKSLVPEKYVESNNALKERFGVRGYPTFVILDSDGVTELGRLKAGKEKTPASFQKELEDLLRLSPAALDAYCASIGEEAGKKYRAMIAELAAKEEESKQADAAVTVANNKANSAKGAIVNLKKKMAAFRGAQLSGEEGAEYDRIKAKYDEAKANYFSWQKTRTTTGQEAVKKQNELAAEIRKYERLLSEY